MHNGKEPNDSRCHHGLLPGNAPNHRQEPSNAGPFLSEIGVSDTVIKQQRVNARLPQGGCSPHAWRGDCAGSAIVSPSRSLSSRFLSPGGGHAAVCRVPSHCILIVEDEPLTGLTLAEMLNEEGHRTIGPISSRKEALTMLDRTRPDCVVLDLTLTDGSSAGLGRELRARGTPFIVFSGHAPDEYPQKRWRAFRGCESPRGLRL